MDTPQHEYFAAFGYITPAVNVEDRVIEYPIYIDEAKRRTGIVNPNLLMAVPPENWIVVWRSEKPTAPDLYVTDEITPVFHEDLGKWIQTYRIRSMTQQETMDFMAQVRLAKREEITQSRHVANNGYFKFKNEMIACDELSMKDLTMTNSLVLLSNAMPPGWVGAWKTVANTYLPISTVPEWHIFFGALYAQGVKNFMHSETLKAMITAANDLHSIKQINWSTETGYDHT